MAGTKAREEVAVAKPYEAELGRVEPE
jgi:hypothetical protein